MKPVTIRLTGVGAILLHNNRLANPMDEYARGMKVISSKRTKTPDDYAELAKLEFEGSLYESADGAIGIPSWNVFRVVQDGAKLRKLGRHVQRAVIVQDADVVPLKHSGPSNPAAAWAANCYDQRPVKVGTSTVTRTRPMFTDWVVEVVAALDENVLSVADLTEAVADAGKFVGLGDYRPRYGRFIGEVLT